MATASDVDASVSADELPDRHALGTAVAVFVLLAGLLHLSAFWNHLDHSTLAVMFLAAGITQVGWAVRFLVRRSRSLLAFGVVANASFVAFYLLTRITGLSDVEGLEVAQPMGLQDLVTTSFQVVAIVGSLALLSTASVARRLSDRLGGTGAALASGFAVILFAPALLAGASHDHASHDHGAHDQAGPHGHADGAGTDGDLAHGAEEHGHGEGAELAAADHTDDHGHTPAGGDAHHPDDDHGPASDGGDAHHADDDHGPGDHGTGTEGDPAHPPGAPHGPDTGGDHAHPPPDPNQPRPPGGGHDHPDPPDPPGTGFPVDWTAEQVTFAEELIATTDDELGRYSDASTLAALGFTWIRDGNEVGGYQHWINLGWFNDEHVLNPEFPESLVFRNTGNGLVLEAAMFILPFGTNLATVPDDLAWLPGWHIHDNLCFNVRGQLTGLAQNGVCESGFLVLTPPMMHVWLVDTECGRFAGVDENGLHCDHEH